MMSAMDTHTDPRQLPAVIEAQDLSRRFGDTVALDAVDLHVPAGQICTLLGRNGAGKTTFIRCALGLLPPTTGSVKVLGEPAGSMAARLGTGVMLQDTDLSEALTAREQLALFSSYYSDPADIDAVIEEADIGNFADTRYKKLSGGQKRRVQFAVALIGKPRLLFLDEPTTGLDTDARRAVWDNVRRLAARGTSIILTTHYLEEADALADRIVVLAQGRVIADDTAAAIRARTGGAIIRCRTSITPEQALALPGVRAADRHGRLLTLSCEHAPTTLRALLDADPDVDDLEVTKPTLEQAFTALSAVTTEDAS